MGKIKFFKDETGAVTVDFVVLTAAIVGLGSAVLTTTAGGTTGLAATISDYLSATETGDYLGPPTYGNIVSWSSSSTPGACNNYNVGGNTITVCGPPITTDVAEFEMSNGEVWTQTTVHDDTKSPADTVTWTNANGDVVDAPEAS